MTPPRQIFASAASRRTGRRWTRTSARRRQPWLPVGLAAAAAGLAVFAEELLRGLG